MVDALLRICIGLYLLSYVGLMQEPFGTHYYFFLKDRPSMQLTHRDVIKIPDEIDPYFFKGTDTPPVQRITRFQTDKPEVKHNLVFVIIPLASALVVTGFLLLVHRINNNNIVPRLVASIISGTFAMLSVFRLYNNDVMSGIVLFIGFWVFVFAVGVIDGWANFKRKQRSQHLAT